MKSRILNILLIAALGIGAVACSDSDNDGVRPLNNKCLKRTLGPNVVGNELYRSEERRVGKECM